VIAAGDQGLLRQDGPASGGAYSLLFNGGLSGQTG